MTTELLRELTNSEPGCYEAPHLNEKLYLNRKGFKVIENLEPYVNVVGLFLDSNGIHQIQNIGHMTNLRMLYLDNNCISKIEGLETLLELHTLNLSSNALTCVDGLQGLKKLETLSLAKNKICSLSDLDGIRETPEVSSLDVSFNQIADTEDVATTIATLVPKLKCLYFNNNPNKRFLQNYRRDFVSKIPGLTFLDDRKVDELERKTSEAWGRGLTRKEVEATRIKHVEEKRAAQRASIEAMQKVQAERAAEIKRLRAAAENGEEESSEHVDINVQRPLGSTATPRVTKKTAISEDAAHDAEVAAPLKEMWYLRCSLLSSLHLPTLAPATLHSQLADFPAT
jgi:dynein assembly factor 1